MKLSITEKNRLFKNYGSWALISGASSGIGKELALNLADAGFNLILTARNEELLNHLNEQIKSQYNVKTHILVADVSGDSGLESIKSLSSDYEIGLLVASAGFGTSGPFIESDLNTEINMIDVNCKALMVLTHHFGNAFKERGKGGIILLSSMVGFQGVPFASNYAATKAYVQSLAEALKFELKPHNVDVLAAAPGPVTTGFAKRSNMVMNGAMKPAQVAIPILRALGRKTTVLPGTLTKILVNSLRTVPRFLKVRIMKIVMSGMTKHQRVKT